MRSFSSVFKTTVRNFTLPSNPSNGNIIDGKKIASLVRKSVKDDVKVFHREHGRTPGLAVILVGGRPDSTAYVRSKIRETEKCGMISKAVYFKESVTREELLLHIDNLNANATVDGILVQLPLPQELDENEVLERVDPRKDVDGLHLLNVGHLMHYGDCSLKACTPAGCIELLKSIEGYEIEGKDAVVIGRSNIVGKPIAQMLTAENATVTVCHSRTKDLIAKVRAADIVVAAIGNPKYVQGDWIKEGAVIIDVGINKVDDRLVGDVDFDSCLPQASYITPVPGGVGPMTIAMLLKNTLVAAGAIEKAKTSVNIMAEGPKQ